LSFDLSMKLAKIDIAKATEAQHNRNNITAVYENLSFNAPTIRFALPIPSI